MPCIIVCASSARLTPSGTVADPRRLGGFAFAFVFGNAFRFALPFFAEAVTMEAAPAPCEARSPIN
eukprot:4277654-Amphidinium_carterae.1